MTTENPTPEKPESEAEAQDSPTETTPEEAAAEAQTTPEAEAAVEVEVEATVEVEAETPAEPEVEAAVEVEVEVVVEPEEAAAPEIGATESTVEVAEAADPAGTSDTTEKDASEFAAAVAEDTRLETKLKSGDRREVKLAQVGEKESFLDFGGASEGSIATSELKNENDELRVQVGETFTAIVKKVGDTVEFTTGRGKGNDTLRLREIETAAENKIPLPGRVKKTNKGGFEIDLHGVRAFCPFSQIDVGYCDDPEQFVGSDLTFRVITFERGGRNIVVSRRKIIEERSKESAVKTRETLETGAVFTGVVRRLQPYGAFIDIGGIDGLVHVSEISHTHVRDPKDILKVGQEVPVKVIKIDGLGTKQERVSLSIKQLEDDPWSSAADKWKVGTSVKGKIARLTEFGAFVELEPGVDGLVHISQISAERIEHPSEALSVGQEIEARVLDVDTGTHRISLSLRPEGEDRPAPRGGGRGGSRPARADNFQDYTARPESEEKSNVDVSGMEYTDAVEALKRKFEQR
jgi:small subunit ribosomal protein S1